jgi:opacity protein-like surface antigen
LNRINRRTSFLAASVAIGLGAAIAATAAHAQAQSLPAVRSDIIAGSVGQSVAPGQPTPRSSAADGASGQVSGALHPYRLIVQSSAPLASNLLSAKLGNANIRVYELTFGNETRQYLLSVETTLDKDDVVKRLKSVPGITHVSEDQLMHTN